MFFKTSQIQVGTISFPIILGFYKYVKHGIVVENSLPFSTTDYSSNRFTIILFNNYPLNSKITGDFKDSTIHTKRLIILTKNNLSTMSVRLTSMEGRKLYAGLGYTLPRNFILTKQ